MNEKAPTLEQVKAARACKEGIEWYAKNEQDTAKLAKRRPHWYFWLAVNLPGDWIVEEEFDHAVKERPVDALFYKHVCERMSDEQFDYAVKKSPWHALYYNHAWERMSDEQFDHAVKERPVDALYNKHVCERMSDDLFDYAVKKWPMDALSLKHACDRMTDEQKAYCERNI